MWGHSLAAQSFDGDKMENWSMELFQADIKAMNYLQLADWLIACRTAVAQDRFDTYEDYVSAVADFCDQWEHFYILHENEFGSKSVFRSKNFKKALLYAGRKDSLKFKIDFKGCSKEVDTSTYANMMQSEHHKKILEEVHKKNNDWYDAVQKIIRSEDDFKSTLHEVLTGKCYWSHEYCIRYLKDGKKQLKAATYKEALQLLENERNYEVAIVSQPKKVGYYQVFKEYDIAPTVYTEYQSQNTCEQEFNKKTFVNLAFLLCYNIHDAERFLRYNGYSIRNRVRQFDMICEKAFRIGFGRDIAIALIDKYNLEKSKEFEVFKPIANLTKHRKAKKVSTTADNTFDNTSSVDSAK